MTDKRRKPVETGKAQAQRRKPGEVKQIPVQRGTSGGTGRARQTQVRQAQPGRTRQPQAGQTRARQTQSRQAQARPTQARRRSPEQMSREAARRRQERKSRKLWWCAQSAILCLILLLFFGIVVQVRHAEGEAGVAGAAPEIPLTGILPATGEDRDTVEEEDEEELGNIPEYARACELEKVGKPTKLEGQKLWNELNALGEQDSRIAEIVANRDMYPEELLVNLASNPEMADFVSNYPGENGAEEAELTKEEKKMKYPLFLQWDPRWGYHNYGESNIAIAGCGPTSLAMALFALTRDESMTPVVLADYAMQNGYYMYGTGTKWALMEEVPVHYGVNSRMLDTDELNMKQALDNGEILICSVRQGDFTAGGHFIVIYGYDDTGFFVNDPNCVARSRMTWDYKQLEHQMKQMWALSQ